MVADAIFLGHFSTFLVGIPFGIRNLEEFQIYPICSLGQRNLIGLEKKAPGFFSKSVKSEN